MNAYEAIKLKRKTSDEVTVAELEAAVKEQEALVAKNAISLARASATVVTTAKDTPFPVEEAAKDAMTANGEFGESLRHLSKLYRWLDKAKAGA